MFQVQVDNSYWDLHLSFTFHGSPVPYTRMTQKGIWRPDAQNYLGYRNALADAIKAKFPELIIPPAPPTSLPALRKKYNAEQNQYTYALGMDVILQRDTGDWSNYYKAVEDALQCARLIWDDRKMTDSLGGRKRVNAENPRVEIKLYRHFEPMPIKKKK